MPPIAASSGRPLPVILDTDLGDDIDDTWALAMLLRSPELDPRLIVTAFRNTRARAQIVAKLLHIAGRADIPIGVGVPTADTPLPPQAPWAADYDLASYPGPVHADGVGALIDAIMNAPEPITLIAIGPLTNVAAALAREPRIAERCARFIGMHGSLRRGYDGSPQPVAEWNVVSAPQACQQVFAAPWEITITPLDTCGLVRLRGDRYQAVRRCADPLIQALMENYAVWAAHHGQSEAVAERSSVLFDTVAVYLALAEDLVEIETLGVRVTDDGYTRIDEAARRVRCATAWRDLSAFEDLLVQRLTSRCV